jgi:uracil-DNA glycosylase family 4
VTAVVRCAPPANKPTTEERDNCVPYVLRELELLPEWRVILALGAFAHGAVASLLGMRPRPTFGHASEAEVPADALKAGALSHQRWLLGSYHPSQQNTFTGKLTEPMLDAVFERARELIGGDGAFGLSG